jgi:hypothetical protein
MFTAKTYDVAKITAELRRVETAQNSHSNKPSKAVLVTWSHVINREEISSVISEHAIF